MHPHSPLVYVNASRLTIPACLLQLASCRANRMQRMLYGAMKIHTESLLMACTHIFQTAIAGIVSRLALPHVADMGVALNCKALHETWLLISIDLRFWHRHHSLHRCSLIVDDLYDDPTHPAARGCGHDSLAAVTTSRPCTWKLVMSFSNPGEDNGAQAVAVELFDNLRQAAVCFTRHPPCTNFRWVYVVAATKKHTPCQQAPSL